MIRNIRDWFSDQDRVTKGAAVGVPVCYLLAVAVGIIVGPDSLLGAALVTLLLMASGCCVGYLVLVVLKQWL